MSEKWTKGPWEYDNRGSSVWQTEGKKDGCMVADVRGWGYLTGLASPGKVPEHEAIEIMDANGRLIAAAPELYAALERIYGLLLMSDRDGECRITEEDGAMADAALRKVRGEL